MQGPISDDLRVHRYSIDEESAGKGAAQSNSQAGQAKSNSPLAARQMAFFLMRSGGGGIVEVIASSIFYQHKKPTLAETNPDMMLRGDFERHPITSGIYSGGFAPGHLRNAA